jgi:hypothetical protein
MNQLPYELIYSIAVRLHSPLDLCSFSQVSTLCYVVSRDDRLWQRFCSRFYHIQLSNESMTKSYYELFTKILMPYGRYLGYWKSNEKYFGGLIHVELNLANGIVRGIRIDPMNSSPDTNQFFFNDDNQDDQNDQDDNNYNKEYSSLKPYYTKSNLFTIDTNHNYIFCFVCNQSHEKLSWRKTFDTDQVYFGLSQDALPVNERSSLISRDSIVIERDIYFIQQCSTNSPRSIIYRPLAIIKPITSDNQHRFARFNGIWVGSYGGHGLELLQLEYCQQFSCPTTVDGNRTCVEVVPDALVATKISGDPNIPHGQMSFAAVRLLANQKESNKYYEGIGQSTTIIL